MILLQTQLVVVVIDMAVSLDQFGNISLFIVQGKGPIPGANPIMYTTSPTTASQEYSVWQTSASWHWSPGNLLYRTIWNLLYKTYPKLPLSQTQNSFQCSLKQDILVKCKLYRDFISHKNLSIKWAGSSCLRIMKSMSSLSQERLS